MFSRGLVPLPNSKTRAERRAQHDAEVEASQADLRHSIAETERLVGESELMLQRHRAESDADDQHREEQARRNPVAGS